ncbi:unnamed protein product, partial [Vitis vinifera]
MHPASELRSVAKLRRMSKQVARPSFPITQNPASLCFCSLYTAMDKRLRLLFILFIIRLPTLVLGECACDEEDEDRDRDKALRYKIAAIASILVGGTIGVCIPIIGKKIPALQPEKNVFFVIKAFAAGVILATGFIHVLPDAFESLTSPCLSENPWANFPFTGFVAMLSAIGTLMVDMGSDLIRHRVISQVLELGIVAHSVIIGISLGASESPQTIKPLVAALTFHQFFEGMGLGSCIVQAKFKSRAATIMGLFFSLTTPVGIGIGIGISQVYDENSSTALIIEGIFNAASAGILIYMALVDLLAADFMSPKMQTNEMLKVMANISLLLGAGCMSLIAKWA